MYCRHPTVRAHLTPDRVGSPVPPNPTAPHVGEMPLKRLAYGVRHELGLPMACDPIGLPFCLCSNLDKIRSRRCRRPAFGTSSASKSDRSQRVQALHRLSANHANQEEDDGHHEKDV